MPVTAQTRVTGGAWRGRLLSTPREQLFRPTRAMVREALFNILGDEVVGAHVVDLFAGAGTVGFEALSRGASDVHFVDRDERALAHVRATAGTLQCTSRVRVVRGDALRWVRSRPAELAAAALVFLDAPYRDDVVLDVLDELGASPPPVVVCEHHRARSLPDRIGNLAVVRRGRYGITDLTVLRPAAVEESPVGERIALYPGSFDPITRGHLDILERACLIFDRVVIAVLQNPSKTPLFTTEERVDLIRRSIDGNAAVEVGTFDGLTVDYAQQRGAIAIVRGLRVTSDFENEFQMTLMNRRLNPDVHTVFLMTSFSNVFISSSIIKEVFRLGGTIDDAVPPACAEALRRKFARDG